RHRRLQGGDWLNQRASRRHVDALGEGAEREPPVELQAIVHVQRDVAQGDALEALKLEGDFVLADREERRAVEAGFIRDDGAAEPGIVVLQRDRDAWENGAGRVSRGTRNRAGRFLRRRDAARQCPNDQQHPEPQHARNLLDSRAYHLRLERDSGGVDQPRRHEATKTIRAGCTISSLAGGREWGRAAGRGAVGRTSAFLASTRWGCSRTGPALS